MLGVLSVCGMHGETRGQDRAHHGMRAKGARRERLSEALIAAVQNKDSDAAGVLLKRGADVNTATAFDKTVLMWAVENRDKEMIDLLLHYKANVNLKDSWSGKTALMRAAEMGYGDIVDLLLDNGADATAKNESEDTALTLAVKKGGRVVVNSLINGGAEIDAKNGDGDTALILAVKRQDDDLVNLLLKRGADPNAKDKSGVDVLTIASEAGNMRSVTLLIRNGAHIDKNLKHTIDMSNAYQKSRIEIERLGKVWLDEKDEGETMLKRAYGGLVMGEKEARELHEKFGIEEFDRYPKETLWKMYANLDKKVAAARPPILHVVARADYSGAVYDYIGWVFRLDHYKAFIAEAESKGDLRQRVAHVAETYGKIETMVIGAHGEKGRMQLGYDEKAGFLSLQDENDIAQLRPYFVSKPTIVMDSCSTGEDETAIAAMVSRALDATVFAPAGVAEFHGCEVDDEGKISGALFDVPTNKFVSGKLIK